MPEALASAQDAPNAKYICLYFWRGTGCVGSCKMPIANIIQALMSQVRCCKLTSLPMPFQGLQKLCLHSS